MSWDNQSARLSVSVVPDLVLFPVLSHTHIERFSQRTMKLEHQDPTNICNAQMLFQEDHCQQKDGVNPTEMEMISLFTKHVLFSCKGRTIAI